MASGFIVLSFLIFCDLRMSSGSIAFPKRTASYMIRTLEVCRVRRPTQAILTVH